MSDASLQIASVSSDRRVTPRKPHVLGRQVVPGSLDATRAKSTDSGPSRADRGGLGNPPPGLPVVKPEPGPQIQLEGGPGGYRLRALAIRRRQGWIHRGEPRDPRGRSDPMLPRPWMRHAKFTVRGMFRGQHFNSVTEVELHPAPDVVASGPPPADPPAASLAVRASAEIIQRYGEGTGSIAIVLDCPGSMVSRGPRKFEDAKKALSQILANVVPPGDNSQPLDLRPATRRRRPALSERPRSPGARQDDPSISPASPMGSDPLLLRHRRKPRPACPATQESGQAEARLPDPQTRRHAGGRRAARRDRPG